MVRIDQSQHRCFDRSLTLLIVRSQNSKASRDIFEVLIVGSTVGHIVSRELWPFVTVVQGKSRTAMGSCKGWIQVEWISVELRKRWVLGPNNLRTRQNQNKG